MDNERSSRNAAIQQETRAERLRMLELGQKDNVLAALLQNEVIRPNLQHILQGFYSSLLSYPLFNEIIGRGFELSHLKLVQTKYLLSLGVNFSEAHYFEDRSRIGQVHVRVGVPLYIYLFAYRKLQQLLIDAIPRESLEASAFDELVAFILKITALDISLAAETYHMSRVRDLQNNLDELHYRHNLLEHEAGLDHLTGLANRQRIMTLLSNSFSTRQRDNIPLSVIMADLDLFKWVNDTYGHQVGDQVLQAIAARIESAVREKDVIGRYGGEEFIVVLANKTLEQASQIAERIRAQVGDTPIKTRNIVIQMTISLGVAEARDSDSVEKLISRADAALYRAKKNGRNTIMRERKRRIKTMSQRNNTIFKDTETDLSQPDNALPPY